MEKHLKRLGLPAVLAVVAALVILFIFDPSRVAIYPVCWFHRLTGLNCPGCGCLRAMHQLLHGNIQAALHLNAMLVLSVPLGAWFGFRLLRKEIQNAPEPVLRLTWLWVYVGMWLVFGILRELPGPIFAAWSP